MANLPARVLLWRFVCVVCLFVVWFVVVVVVFPAFYGMIIHYLQFFWTGIVTLYIYWYSWLKFPTSILSALCLIFTNIFKSPLAHEWSIFREEYHHCLFISHFKAMHNPPSQLAGEVCLQIYFFCYDGLRHIWALTPPVKTTCLVTVIFNFLATPNTPGPTPVSGTGMLPQ